MEVREAAVGLSFVEGCFHGEAWSVGRENRLWSLGDNRFSVGELQLVGTIYRTAEAVLDLMRPTRSL